MNNFQIGQTVYTYEQRRHNDGMLKPAQVVKVGRKWVSLSGGDRFDIDTLQLDGLDNGYGPGRVYFSVEAFQFEQDTAKAREEIRSYVVDNYGRLTLHNIMKALTILKGESK